MSRIGNRTLTIPEGVTVEVNNQNVIVKGSKGSLNLNVDSLIKVVVADNTVVTNKVRDTDRANVLQGTTNSLIENMLIGVSEGYTKNLEIVGVGYRFGVQGNKLNIGAGFSHPMEMVAPEGLTITLVNANEISIGGIDKQNVSEFAAKIRDVRRPEPYKGKGIRYKDEHVRRKEGKKAAK